MADGHIDRQTWRVRDVFYVLLLYFVILIIFLFIESKVFGKGVLEDTNLNPGILILEDFVDAIIFALLPILFVTRLYESNLKEIGISFRNFRKNLFIGLIFGVLLWVGVSICDMVVKKVLGELPIHPYIQKLEMSDSHMIYFVVLTSIIILGPISEEIYFRGFAHTVLKKRYGKSVGIILSSLLFAGVHFNLYWGIQIFLIGIGLALLVESTGSIISVVVAHSSINLLSVYVGRL
jgi:hypothetical protein